MFNTTTTVETRKISCQYSLSGISDLSPTHPLNLQNNSWTVIEEFPTEAEIQADPSKDKKYIAHLWARKEEEIVFSAKFGRGSHMNVRWHLLTDGNDATYTDEDNCTTKAGVAPEFDPPIAFNADEDQECKFPFRYNDTLFYGCSNFTLSDATTNMCATLVDEDYNAKEVGLCNDYCHIQGNTNY